jgi:hypothetical protein
MGTSGGTVVWTLRDFSPLRSLLWDNGQTLDDVLAQIDMSDADCRAGNYQILEESDGAATLPVIAWGTLRLATPSCLAGALREGGTLR